jgi:hypothetical protein
VITLEIFGQNNIEFGYEVCDAEYRVIAVHLEWNLIFLAGEDRTLLAYDMNHKKVHASLHGSSTVLDLPGVYVSTDLIIFLMFPCS